MKENDILTEKISYFHYEDMKNEDHPSIFFKSEDYDLLILRLPNSISNKINYLSLSFIISNKEYFYFDKEKKEFIKFEDIKAFYKFLDKYIDNVLNSLEFYSNEIEKIEDRIYEDKPIKEFNKQWFIYKKELIRINRVLNKTSEIFTLFTKAYEKQDDYLERNFEDIFEHLTRSSRNSGHLLEKLDSIYNFNLNQTNDQMNRIVYILTLLSGIFLPLNLIVGFFGMNTTSLPFTKVDGGTFNVIFLLFISAILATLITLFMKKK